MQNQTVVSENTIVVVAKDQVSCDLAGEAAILNLKSGIYFGLNPVGARIWELVQQPTRVSAILSILLDEYDVEKTQCENDLLKLLHQLQTNELIEVKTANDESAT